MLRRVLAGTGVTLLIGTGVAAAGAPSTSPPGSTEPASIAPTTVAASTATGASTTVAPTTTLDPVAAEEAAVAQAAVAARTARFAALVNPDDPAAIAALDELYVAGGEARQEIDRFIQHLRDNDQRLAPNPDVPDSLTVEAVELTDAPPSSRAFVTACVVEAGVIYGGVTETSEVVMQNDVRALRTEYVMVNEDGVWKVDTAMFVEDWPGETTCPPLTPATTVATTLPAGLTEEEALVAQRVVEIDAISWSAYFSPDALGTAEALDSIYTEGGETRQVVESDLQALRDEGWVVRPNPDIPQSITVEQVTLLDGPPATRADVIVCIIDPTFLIDPAGLPDGSDLIVNDDIWAFRSVQHLVIEDGTWQVDDVDDLDEWTGVAACPAA